MLGYRIAANCRKMLDSGRVTEHDGEMYCGACYRKLFGPKGYGFGALNMDDGKGYTVSQPVTILGHEICLPCILGDHSGRKKPSVDFVLRCSVILRAVKFSYVLTLFILILYCKVS